MKATYEEQVPIPTSAADVPGPASGTVMTKEYAQMVGRMAYVWGWPMVNSHNRRAGFAYVTSQNGNVPGWNGGVLPMAPIGQLAMLNDYIKPEQTFVVCPNQDVAYGAGYHALDQESVVFQVPDFGDRYRRARLQRRDSRRHDRHCAFLHRARIFRSAHFQG
jgi:hypothetical protein